MYLDVTPEVLLEAGAEIEALTAAVATAEAAAAPALTAPVPPASDPVSMARSLDSSQHGLAHLANSAWAGKEMLLSAEEVAASGASYLMGDLTSAAAFGAFA